MKPSEDPRFRSDSHSLRRIAEALERGPEPNVAEYEAFMAREEQEFWDMAFCAALTGYLSGSPDADCGTAGYVHDAAMAADAALTARRARIEGKKDDR